MAERLPGGAGHRADVGAGRAGTRLRTRLPDDPSIAAAARLFVRTVFAEWECTAAEPDASLLATELVTNGLRHGGGARWMELWHRGDRLRISVVDNAPLRAPRRRQAALTAESGRGLALVEAVAVAWGSERTRLRRGKVVWCELAV